MTSFKKPSFARSMATWLIVVPILSVLMLGGMWIVFEIHNQKIQARELAQTHIDRHKELLKTYADNMKFFVDFKHSQIHERVRENLLTRVDEAFVIADSLKRQCERKGTPEKLAETIIRTLTPIRFNEGRGYYFAIDLSGIITLHPDNPAFQGQPVSVAIGGLGECVACDLIDIVRKDGEGFH
ncbi:MAG: cache domain-containing protein, partial [Pseudomonadota bacterium]|nr:cache domain-containing protein [Pseudomonadota bacterium]